MFLFKYPKFLLFSLIIVIAVLLFHFGKTIPGFHDFLVSLGYAGVFLAGFFYAYSFTATPATAVLLVLAKDVNLLTAVLLGGFGALISDVIIFLFIRTSFNDEIKRLNRERFVKRINKLVSKAFGSFDKYVVPVIAGFLIASPLPTEVGVSLMSSVKVISLKKFMIIAYLLHTIGILTILSIGKIF